MWLRCAAVPGDVAWFLASYARDAKARVEAADLPALDAIRTALEEALSITFEGKRGSHFFLSTLVQTLFYGVFSAWVLWSKQHPPGNRKARFDWRTSAHYLRVPILRKLFYEAADPGQLDALNLSEVLELGRLRAESGGPRILLRRLQGRPCRAVFDGAVS